MESNFEAENKLHKKQSRFVMDNLVKGKEYASQLEALLLNHKPFGDEVLVLAQELVQKVVKSFTDALSCGSTSEAINCHQDYFHEVVEWRPELVKERRGAYKRRRVDDSWIIVSETTEDGYAWRKYGQKQILNSKHPRCYYRCTHKYDQECRAMKQVQKIDMKDSTMFKTTYISHHTCKDTTKPSQTISDPSVDPLKSKLISFQGHTQHVPPYNVNLQELKVEEETQSDLTDCKSSINSSIWQDLVSSSFSESPMEFSSETRSNYHGKVASRTGLDDLDIKTLARFADFNNQDFLFYENASL